MTLKLVTHTMNTSLCSQIVNYYKEWIMSFNHHLHYCRKREWNLKTRLIRLDHNSQSWYQWRYYVYLSILTGVSDTIHTCTTYIIYFNLNAYTGQVQARDVHKESSRSKYDQQKGKISNIVLSGVHSVRSLAFCVVFCRSLFVLLSCFICPLSSLFFIELRIICPFGIIKLFSLNSASHKKYI